MKENIIWQGQVLCSIIQAQPLPAETAFYTPTEYSLQVGYIVHPAGHQIPRHIHRPIERRIFGTPEVLIVSKGCCELDVYNDAHQLVASRELREGDIAIMLAGGHGFRMLKDTVLLEIKQGPYTGLDDQQRF